MKYLKITKITALTVFSIFFIIACTKDSVTSTEVEGGGSSNHLISTFEDSDEQSKWIAKGFASLVSNLILKTQLET